MTTPLDNFFDEAAPNTGGLDAWLTEGIKSEEFSLTLSLDAIAAELGVTRVSKKKLRAAFDLLMESLGDRLIKDDTPEIPDDLIEGAKIVGDNSQIPEKRIVRTGTRSNIYNWLYRQPAWDIDKGESEYFALYYVADEDIYVIIETKPGKRSGSSYYRAGGG